MKKLILIFLVLFSLKGYSQKFQYVHTFGYEYRNLRVDSLLQIPRDTFLIPENMQDYPHAALIGSTLYGWNITTHVWVAVSGSGMSNPMTTLGDIIIGGASGVPTRLGIGTAGQLLKVNAGATAVEYFTPAYVSTRDRFGFSGEDVLESSDNRFFNNGGFNFRVNNTNYLQWHTQDGMYLTAGSSGTGTSPIATITVQPDLNEWVVDDGTGSAALKLYPDEVELYNDEGVNGDLYLTMRDFFLELSAGNKSTLHYSKIRLREDSIKFEPHGGIMNIDSLRSWSGAPDTTYKKVMTYDTRNGRWEYSNWFGGAGGSSTLNSITAANGDHYIDNGDYNVEWSWGGLTGGNAFLISSDNTGATSDNQVLFSVDLHGANANSGEITHAALITNSHTGTSSTNIGLHVSAFSGTNNYAIVVPINSGNVGIGTSSPSELLSLGQTGDVTGVLSLSGSTSGKVIIQPANAAGTYTLTLPTTDGASGEFLQTNGSGVLTWAAASASGATVALDNLSAVAINAALVLGTSDAFALGSASKQWSDLFLAEGGVINWDNGDATLTQVGNTVTLNGADLTVNGKVALTTAGGIGSGIEVTSTSSYASIDYINSSAVRFQTGLYPTGGGNSDKAFFYHAANAPISFFTNNTERLIIAGAGTITMPVYGAGTATFDASGNISSVSDVRLKNVQNRYTVGLDAIMKIKPISYKWNSKSGMETKHVYNGFSAQNVQYALGKDAVGVNQEGYLSIQDRNILAALVNAVQEQQREIEYLKKQLRK